MMNLAFKRVINHKFTEKAAREKAAQAEQAEAVTLRKRFRMYPTGAQSGCAALVFLAGTLFLLPLFLL